MVPKRTIYMPTRNYFFGAFPLYILGKLYEVSEEDVLDIASQLVILSHTDDIEDIEGFLRGRFLLNTY